MSTPDITICSVFHSSESRDLIRLNKDFIERCNPDASWEWLVTDNSPKDDPIPLGDGFTVIPGYDRRELAGIFTKPIVHAYHHSLALNKLVPLVKTRFAVYLDNDFFILRPKWITEITRHMQDENLAMIGSPWHPRYYKKFRYHPAHHALFVDHERVDVSHLDFTPAYLDDRMFASRNPHGTFPGTERKPHGMDFLHRLGRNLRDRKDIGISRDTGYAVYRLLRDSGEKSECFVPVWNPEGHRLSRTLDLALPDRFSYVPKRDGYFTNQNFASFGLPDFDATDMEEYLWKGAPFATHIRNTWKRENIAAQSALLHSALNRIV